MSDENGATAQWLTTPEAERVLDDLRGQEVTPALIARLRKTLTPQQASAAVLTAELRLRARRKFSRADRMLFTRRGLEQATDEWVARHKRDRIVRTSAAGSSILDVCCGIGGDLIALASTEAATTGVDHDPEVACFAEHNLSVYEAPAAILCDDATTPDPGTTWHADPDRRPEERRTTNPESHEPSLSTLESWLQEAPNAAFKLAPAARLPEHWVDASELEWISRGGECRQLVAWRGALAEAPGKRRATRVSEKTEDPPASFLGDPIVLPDLVDQIGPYVYEPDPGVLAAGLDGALAAERGLAPFSTHAAYYTGPTILADPLLASFQVEEVMPLDRKALSRLIAERGIGRLEIKCRGVEIDPERLRADLRPQGDNALTLIVAPSPASWPGGPGKPLALLCHRAHPN